MRLLNLLSSYLLFLYPLPPSVSAFAPPTQTRTANPSRQLHRTPKHIVHPILPSNPSALDSAARWIGTSIIGGTVGTPFVLRATSSWYRKIRLPTWTPPDRVFAPVWTTLYACMGYATHRVWNTILGARVGPVGLCHPVLRLAMFHYALNLAWAPLFFGTKRLRAGHVLNVAIVLTLVPTVVSFYRIDVLSGLLLLPYLVWVAFATKLRCDAKYFLHVVYEIRETTRIAAFEVLVDFVYSQLYKFVLSYAPIQRSFPAPLYPVLPSHVLLQCNLKATKYVNSTQL